MRLRHKVQFQHLKCRTRDVVQFSHSPRNSYDWLPTTIDFPTPVENCTKRKSDSTNDSKSSITNRMSKVKCVLCKREKGNWEMNPLKTRHILEVRGLAALSHPRSKVQGGSYLRRNCWKSFPGGLQRSQLSEVVIATADCRHVANFDQHLLIRDRLHPSCLFRTTASYHVAR